MELTKKEGSKGLLQWLDSLTSFIKNNTFSSKLVLREDPRREREPEPQLPLSPKSNLCLVFHAWEHGSPTAVRLYGKQAFFSLSSSGYLWQLGGHLVLGDGYRDKLKHGEFHKSRYSCPSRGIFCSLSPEASVQSLWVCMGTSCPGFQVVSTISHLPSGRKRLIFEIS